MFSSLMSLPSSFNPRLRTGGDDEIINSYVTTIKFQSTPPHGRRLFHGFRSPYISSSFNPRLRTGGDRALPCSTALTRLFQSTPPHGRRRIRQIAQIKRPLVSIHASAREATILMAVT